VHLPQVVEGSSISSDEVADNAIATGSLYEEGFRSCRTCWSTDTKEPEAVELVGRQTRKNLKLSNLLVEKSPQERVAALNEQYGLWRFDAVSELSWRISQPL
jgi:hypothetical protein